MSDPDHRATALSRRSFLQAGIAVAGGTVLGVGALAARRARAGDDDSKRALVAAGTSPLIYVSPLKSNGLESHCHAEVWFVAAGRDLLVVTDAERWRAACIGKGLDRARIWVGDFGVWKKSDGAFRKAPSYLASARIDANPEAHARALEAFGSKYADGWGTWGPRFREGLASGKRVMIRYSPGS